LAAQMNDVDLVYSNVGGTIGIALTVMSVL